MIALTTSSKNFLYVDGIVINMVVGGEVLTLKSLEESSGLLIAEMPINVSSASQTIFFFSSTQLIYICLAQSYQIGS